MKMFYPLALLALCVLLSGCGGSQTTTQQPPAPLASDAPTDVLRAGDKINVRLSGVPDEGFLVEVQIPTDGYFTLPYLTRKFQAIGVSTGDLAAIVIAAYKSDKIYTNPQVTVIPEDRFVSLGGDVRGPSSVAYRPDLTLLTAINSCGGFDEYADRKNVAITRGKQRFIVDVSHIQKTPGADPKLYPGDQIYVPRTPF